MSEKLSYDNIGNVKNESNKKEVESRRNDRWGRSFFVIILNLYA